MYIDIFACREIYPQRSIIRKHTHKGSWVMSLISQMEFIYSCCHDAAHLRKDEKSHWNKEKLHLFCGRPVVSVSPYLSLFVSAVEHSHAAVINYRLPPARSHPSLVLLDEAVYSASGFTIDCNGNCRKWCFENPFSLFINCGMIKDARWLSVWINDRVWNWNTFSVTVLKVHWMEWLLSNCVFRAVGMFNKSVFYLKSEG